MEKVKRIVSANATWVVLICLMIFFTILSPNFMTLKNMITVLRQVSVNGICAVGLAIILIGGGIDLSTGSQTAVAGMLCATLMVNHGWPVIPSFLIAIVVTALTVGTLNGMAVAYTGMPPLIATLGTQNVARGIAYLITDGYIIYNIPELAKVIGQGSIAKTIPYCVLLFIFILFVGNFILNKTSYGRMLFAVGSNKEAARLSGIPVKKIQISSFIVGSLFISLGGVVLMSRLNSGIPNVGTDIYIEILSACIIGGISSNGGRGNVFKMLGGVLIMGVISNGMNVAGISEYYQYIVKGSILLVSVGLDSYRTVIQTSRRSHVIRSAAKESA
ncbi:MAG: ABC transporter permease [Solobacterium sp.]|nr:ABC transporter permease [Solobacterium sp.]MBR2668769.1 ABC transporter permease [Solobacterium sp.]